MSSLRDFLRTVGKEDDEDGGRNVKDQTAEAVLEDIGDVLVSALRGRQGTAATEPGRSLEDVMRSRDETLRQWDEENNNVVHSDAVLSDLVSRIGGGGGGGGGGTVYYTMLPEVYGESESEFETALRRSWPLYTSILCWHCAHPFTGRPIPIVKMRLQQHRFKAYGCFCSIACALAYARDERYDMQSGLRFIEQIITGRKFSAKELRTAPARETLKAFGGILTIDEFRALGRSSLSDRLEISILKAPLFPIKQYVEITYRSPTGPTSTTTTTSSRMPSSSAASASVSEAVLRHAQSYLMLGSMTVRDPMMPPPPPPGSQRRKGRGGAGRGGRGGRHGGGGGGGGAGAGPMGVGRGRQPRIIATTTSGIGGLERFTIRHYGPRRGGVA